MGVVSPAAGSRHRPFPRRQGQIDAIHNALFERIDHTLNDPAEIRRIIEEALATVPAEDFPTITYDMGPEPTTSQFTRESEWTNRIPPFIGRTWERVRCTNATALLSASLTSGRRCGQVRAD